MRNYMGRVLNEDQLAIMSNYDKIATEFKSSDMVVFAYPMHNFCMPGIVKTYFDCVMMKEETWSYQDSSPTVLTKGKPFGLMSGKKVLTIFTSGGNYDMQKQESHSLNPMIKECRDTITPLSKILFDFMGFSESSVICTSCSSNEGKTERFEKAKENILTYVKNNI